MPCDMAGLMAAAAQHGLPVIEDAACAVGSELLWEGRWERVGRPHGLISCFSFHPRKVMSTGDGGMLTTSDPDLDARFRLLRQHGMSVNDRVRHSSNQVIFEDHSVIGFNYRMTDIQAAVGREQLKRLPGIVEARRSIADRYGELLAEVEGFEPPHEPSYARSNWQSYSVRLPDAADQRDVMQAMLDRGVATRRGIMCAHREVPYAGDHHLPASEWAQDRHIILPLYPQMEDDDLVHVCDSLRAAVRGQLAGR
jgi:perosamine synthetase